MKFRFVIVVFLVLCTSCATITPEILRVRSHKKYSSLSDDERELVEKIMSEAIHSSRKDYYFINLIALLDTPTNPLDKIKQLSRSSIEKSIEERNKTHRSLVKRGAGAFDEYINKEEFYEGEIDRNWKGYRPYIDGPYFYVVDENPLDLLVHIKVRLRGPYEVVKKILSLEDSIEKHLSMPGFSVNLAFVNHSSTYEEDVFDVRVDIGKWATSHNWSGGHTILAHELMHLMGLPDEYDRIESHARNRNMTLLNRLGQFYMQMGEELPRDASRGIMCYHNLKPLQRHICAAVGLGEECVSARNQKYK